MARSHKPADRERTELIARKRAEGRIGKKPPPIMVVDSRTKKEKIQSSRSAKAFSIFKQLKKDMHESKKLNPILPMAGLIRKIKEIAQDYKTDVRFQKSAIFMLRIALEAFLVKILTATTLVTMNGEKVTIKHKDMAAVVEVLKTFAPTELNGLFDRERKMHIPTKFETREKESKSEPEMDDD